MSKIYLKMFFGIMVFVILFSVKVFAAENYFLKVDAKFNRNATSDDIMISGTTNLPDNSKILINLNSPKSNVAKRRAYVSKGTFSTQISLLQDNRLVSWDYTVEAQFSHAEQTDPNVLKTVVAVGKNIILAKADVRVGEAGEADKAMSESKDTLIKDLKEINQIYLVVKKYNDIFIADKDKKLFKFDAWRADLFKLSQESSVLSEKYTKEDFIKRYPQEESAIRTLATNLPRFLTAMDRKFNRLDAEKIQITKQYSIVESPESYLTATGLGLQKAANIFGITLEDKIEEKNKE